MSKGMSKSTAIIQRLLEERRQYEAWIARLNSSADATPGNVRARVREDYEARLVAVMEELKAHAESARLAIQEKRHMRGELQKKEALAAEKLTETELRHSVGEYDESQWAQVHELEFIKSVTEDDTGAAPSPRRASGAQFQPTIPSDPPRAAAPPSQRAANPVPAPIVPDPSAAGDEEVERTLRCKQCGTMNLPTEWDCGQCGVQLDAG